MRKFFLSLVLLLYVFKVFSQGAKGGWFKIHEDSDIKVELKFTIPIDTCGPNSKYRYSYRVTGKYKAYNQYLNWKMDYTACNGKRYYIQNSVQIGKPNGDDISGGMTLQSIDYNIPGIEYIERTHYDVTPSTREEKKSGILPSKVSIPPKDVEGPDEINWGESFELSVKGGELGLGAKWVWYEGRCGGKKIDTGEKLTLNSLSDSTAFYVRAEGTNNNTKCAWKVVLVDKTSKTPKGVNGRAKICIGESSALNVIGGSLGPGAQWIWYANNCGLKPIGSGNSIMVTPTQTTTYLVRGEGPLNTTNCASVVVSVHEKSKDPVGIEYKGDGVVCAGSQIQMSIKGGKLSSDATWKWYINSCGSNPPIGTGNVLQATTSNSTTFYVRAEGGCNTTNCAAYTINVEQRSSLPNLIVAPSSVFKRAKTTLSLSGGYLGNNAEWKWYEKRCGKGNSIGEGSNITVRPRKKTTYFVQADGKCQDGNCTSVTITPLKLHSFDRRYKPGKRKFFQFGLGLGVDYTTFSDWITFNNSGFWGSIFSNIQGVGLTGDIVLHPIMKEWLSIGLMSSLTVGFPAQKTNDATGATILRYRYVRPTVGMEIALGPKNLKFLGNLIKTLQTNDYAAKDNSSTDIFLYNREWNRQTLGLGLRIGKYSNKKGSTLDVLYTLNQNTSDTFFNPGKELFKNLIQRYPGLSLVWWRQSLFKIKADIILSDPQTDLFFGNPEYKFKNATYQLSLIINRNWFY